MITLLHSLFYRVKRDKLFYGLLVVFLIIPVVFILRFLTNKTPIDSLFPMPMCFISIAFTLLVHSYIGVEYADGTIRNKIIVGKKRYSIYLSYWLFLIVIGLSIFTVYMLTILCIGIPVLGTPNIQALTIFSWVGIQILTIVAFISIFVFLSFICSNHTVSIIVNMLLAFALIVGIILLLNRVSTPEYIDIYQWSSETGKMELLKVLNPAYPSDVERNMLMCILYVLPSSFFFSILFGVSMNGWLVVLILIGISCIFTGIGIFLFTRKDLK